MYVNGLRKFLYAGALLALAPVLGTAAEPIPAPATPAPVGSCAPACAPTTCKVKVCEWVDEPCETTRTVYKRRGMGKTNIYKIKFVVQRAPKNAKRQIS